MKPSFLFPAIVTLTMAAGTGVAHADMISLYAQANGGVEGGKGLSGDRQDDAFHKGAQGLTYGAKVGVEIVFIDVWVEHDQYISGDGVDGTFTQFMTGVDVELDVGGTKGGRFNAEGKRVGSYSKGYAELGMGLGFGLGTGQQVDPPLDNSQVTDKGFLGQGHVGAGLRITPRLSLGVTVPVQVGYMFKSGPGSVANDTETHYVQTAAAALLSLRFKVQLK